MVASSSPDTVNPAADQCEANGDPVPGQLRAVAAVLSSAAAPPRTSPSSGPRCTTSAWKTPPSAAWACGTRSRPTRRWRSSSRTTPTARPGPTRRRARSPSWSRAATPSASKPEMYQPPSEDFTSQISAFKKTGCEVCTGVQTPPDFTNFWKQCAQQGYQPKILTISKALALPPDHRSRRRHRHRPVRPHGLASQVPVQELPHRPDLPGVRGTSTRPRPASSGPSRSASWASTSGRSTCSSGSPTSTTRRCYVDAIKTTKFDGINGPVDFTLPVKPGTVASGPERVQDQDRRRPVGQIRGSQVQVRHLHLLRARPEHAHPEEVRAIVRVERRSDA